MKVHGSKLLILLAVILVGIGACILGSFLIHGSEREGFAFVASGIGAYMALGLVCQTGTLAKKKYFPLGSRAFVSGLSTPATGWLRA